MSEQDKENEQKQLRRRYEKLLFERDRYQKEAEEALQEYIRIFGELLIEEFRLKISCIEKKKMIYYCQARLNREEAIDTIDLSEYLRREMEEYRQQLEKMIADNRLCQQCKEITRSEVLQVKRLYRRIAKKIHPDLHPNLPESAVLSELWTKVMDAYHRNDLRALEELEIQIDAALRELGNDVPEECIPDVEEKIRKLEAEIKIILSTEPYQYRFLLEDEEQVRAYREELLEEIEDYKRYENRLIDILKQILAGGATFVWEN